MSTKIKYKVEKTIVNTIDPNNIISLNEINNICTELSNSLKNKIERFKTILNSCNVSFNNNLIINDEYNTALNLKNILIEFGFNVREEKTNGTTYTCIDDNMKLLCLFNYDLNKEFSSYLDLSNNINSKNTIENDILKDNDLNHVKTAINHVLNNETFTTKEINEYVETRYYHTVHREKDIKNQKYQVLDLEKGKTKRNELDDYIKSAKKLNDIIKERNFKSNNELVNGTNCVIKTRAKAMGYNVEEKKTDKGIQLVLVSING